MPLAETRHERAPPRLRLVRLRFVGEKRLEGVDEPRAIHYDQAIEPGVNVVLIEDNDVGKSSILKTIKFALTGDDGAYDDDVRDWLHDIWLTFAVDSHVWTTLISRRGGVHGALVLGEEHRLIEDAVQGATLFWEARNLGDLKAELERFFFQRLGLSELSWTAQSSATGAIATGGTTWAGTYFQALQLLDDAYLLCDPEHSYGHQEGLILAAFLGLRLTEPLNRLGLEAQRIRKERRAEQSIAEEEARHVEAEVAGHEARIREAERALATLNADIRRRQEVALHAQPAVRLDEVHATLAAHAIERGRLTEEREDLGQRIRRANSESRRLREGVKLRLHFTGLNVSVCPSCDREVDGAAIAREQDEHLCRLCGQMPPTAPADEVAAMEVQAADAEARAQLLARERDSHSTRLRQLADEVEALTAESKTLQEAVALGLDATRVTPEEEAERLRLAQEIGDYRAQIRMARARVDAQNSGDDEGDARVRILDKARDLLKQRAQDLNRELLTRLGAIVQEVVQRIGAESMSDVTVLPLGDVQFSKNGVRVTFGSLRNPGDRLRVKLAFFLAMMRLGREPGFGYHPGLLLIDQPGGAEIVPEDASALAGVLRAIDADLTDQVQLLCFTARPEFRAATAVHKVYGPQGADGCAF